jgi:hypothetical protein
MKNTDKQTYIVPKGHKKEPTTPSAVAGSISLSWSPIERSDISVTFTAERVSSLYCKHIRYVLSVFVFIEEEVVVTQVIGPYVFDALI